MTRSELYELVWKDPMTHLAKRFGVSDVALRKTCVKHNIPTPPLGYWAKLAFGKKISQPALPPIKNSKSELIHLTIRPPQPLPASVSAVLDAAEQQEMAPEMKIAVPKVRPKDLHPIMSTIEKAIRKCTPNDEGFLIWGGKDGGSIAIGSGSAERAIILLDSFAKAMVTRGYDISVDADIEIRVENEPFKLKIYETKSKQPHQPTPADLKNQARYDEDNKRYPSWYPPGKTVWRTWDRFPSGRLCVEITDPTQYRWNSQNLVGRWYDRKAKCAEDYLSEAIVALAGAAALAKYRRGEAEKQARIQAEQEELRRRDKARRERDLKRHEYLAKKAEAYEGYCRLVTLQKVFGPRAKENGDDQFHRIVSVLQKLVETEGRQFESAAIAEEVINLKLFSEDDEI